MTEVVDLTLEEPAIEDIVRTLYGVGSVSQGPSTALMRKRPAGGRAAKRLSPFSRRLSP